MCVKARDELKSGLSPALRIRAPVISARSWGLWARGHFFPLQLDSHTRPLLSIYPESQRKPAALIATDRAKGCPCHPSGSFRAWDAPKSHGERQAGLRAHISLHFIPAPTPLSHYRALTSPGPLPPGCDPPGDTGTEPRAAPQPLGTIILRPPFFPLHLSARKVSSSRNISPFPPPASEIRSQPANESL